MKLEEVLKSAIGEDVLKMHGYVWLDTKIWNNDNSKFTQETHYMMQTPIETLKKWEKHCIDMLYSTNKNHLGRTELLKWAEIAKYKCLAELYLRSTGAVDRREFYRNLKSLLNQPQYLTKFPPTDYDKIPIGDAIQLPKEFEQIPISIILKAALNDLGFFTRKPITLRRICNYGIRPTKEELTRFFSNSNLSLFEQIKQTLQLPRQLILHRSPNGLSYSQFRAIIHLRYTRYSQLTTELLDVLSKRILPDFQESLKIQIDSWKERLNQLQEVIAYKAEHANE